MAVNGKSRRSYRGAPVSNTLGTTLSVAATNITLAVAMSGFSTDAEPFFVVVDPGTAKEEKICVKYSSATTLTVVDPAVTSVWGASAAGRGADNTVDRQHEQGAAIYPVFTALEANQANELVSKFANAGSVVHQGVGAPGTFTELAIGTAAQVLKVNAGATAPEWGQVSADGIATGAVTSAKILDATIVQADLALTLLKALCPVGSINAYAGATAPTGWILCNGTAVVSGTHPELYALCATTPDLRGSFALGKAAAGTGSTLLGTGGSTSIAEANLPSHSHANTTAFTGTSNQAVTTTSTAHTHSVTSNVNNVVFTGTPVADHVHSVYTEDKTIVNGADSNWGVPKSTAGNAYNTAGAGGHTPAGSVTLTNNAVTSGAMSANGSHDHTVTATGTVTVTIATTGSGTAYYQPFLAVNYIIKHDYV